MNNEKPQDTGTNFELNQVLDYVYRPNIVYSSLSSLCTSIHEQYLYFIIIIIFQSQKCE